jgi:pyruvate kinase
MRAKGAVMDIIATIGPSALSEARVSSLLNAGVTIFRINGAHASADWSPNCGASPMVGRGR